MKGRRSVEEEYKKQIKYAVVYTMIKDLLEEGAIDLATAEKINDKCAEELESRRILIR